MRTFRAQGNVSSAGGGAEGQELSEFVPDCKSGMGIRLAPFSCLCANLSDATIRGVFSHQRSDSSVRSSRAGREEKPRSE